MLPDRVSNLGPLTYESGTLPIAQRGPAAGGLYVAFVNGQVVSVLANNCLRNILLTKPKHCS